MSDEEQILRKGRFLREQVHKKLKENIINGILPPHKRLIEEKIAAEMEMSRTPVREAIQKLEKEGLIYKLPRGGYAIGVITAEDIDDVFGLRGVIEGYAAYLATHRATEADLAILEDIVSREEKCLQEKNYDLIIELNTEFHEKLYRAARSAKLYSMIYDLRDYIHRFRVMILRYQDFVEISIKDHKDMIALMRLKDAAHVEKLVRKHIARGKNLLKKRIKKSIVRHGSDKKGASGGWKSAARLISMIEEGGHENYRIIPLLFSHTGKAHTVGITGAPGAGKSTLINKLALYFADKGNSVGIIAVDPTSSKGRGAFLGDRIRMTEAEQRRGIFIRSMASRGCSGGISSAAAGAIYVLEALGKNIVMVETVGAGQTDMQINALCNTVVTVLTPDYGDEIQLIKAGLLEIGDIAVINKAENASCEDIPTTVEKYVDHYATEGWQIPVIPVQAREGEGIEKLVDALDAHFAYLNNNATAKSLKKKKLRALMLALLKEEIWRHYLNIWADDERFDDILKKLQDGEIDPYTAVRAVTDIKWL